MLLDKNSIIDEVKWSATVRTCIVRISEGTPTTVIADMISLAINELAVLPKPRSWANEATQVRANHDTEKNIIEVSLTLVR